MKLVIDIPESILNTIQADEMISREQLAVLQMHIINATPLTDCTDAISREEVTHFVKEFVNNEYATKEDCEFVDLIVDGVNHLPSVNPTTNRAKWIKVGEHLYECSCCGYNYRNYDGQVMKFCMNCGSVMEGGE